MGFFRKKRDTKQTEKKVWAIKRSTLRMILESARSMHPKEFSGMLRAEGGVINEVMLLPGTKSGNTHSIMQLHMLPIDFSVVGSVHSHPSPDFWPSGADIHFFRNFKNVHVIVAYPYNESSWRAYDYNGRGIEIEIVD